ncbi:RNA-directed DNA polymerase [Acidobacteria bacterium Mor1]|nr:RNA-directed DNA polymerase [Acidobacteria bacterium Mor1]
MHKSLDDHLAQHPPSTINALTPVGYTGFRWATQIEPFWNAYYLALCIALASKIEETRIPEAKKQVFSYRFCYDGSDSKLFAETAWKDYRARALQLARKHKHVITTDIADFYPRIYHHRLENALKRLPSPGDVPARLMKLVGEFSGTYVSYGLPIGGPASRILSELCLADVDLRLSRQKIEFCRYADDFTIFCNDHSEAYRILVLLSEALIDEGLVLQKRKTRIMSSSEFLDSSSFLDPDDQTPDDDESKLLRIAVRFDPYSESAAEDYERLRASLQEIDIVGILAREVAKTTIDTTITKQAINAIRALDSNYKSGAIRTLLDPSNLAVLSPVFATVVRCVRGVYDELDDDTKELVDRQLVDMFQNENRALSLPIHQSYYVQALSRRRSAEKEEILIDLFDSVPNPLVRREVMLAMAEWDCHYWLSQIKRRFGELSLWEKRVFIYASYRLGDEGKHWRQHTKHTWSPMDNIIAQWARPQN